MNSFKNYLFVAALATASVTTAFASGNHAGGHNEDESAIGKEGNAKKVTRTVKVDMKDTMRFTPANITVKQGETVRFLITNSGKLKHEFVLGTEDELKEHAEAMKKNPEMEHADANMLTLLPGKKGKIVWQFTKPGKVDFACLQPGHYESGMRGEVTVTGKAGTKSKPDASAAASVADGQSSVIAGTSLPNAKVAESKPTAATTTTTAVTTTTTTTSTTVNTALSDGVVRKIDKDAGKITIKHGPLVNLDMPAMTMVFRVKDPAMLSQVKEGDAIKFTAEKVGGALTVTTLESSK